jgi:hypothetical protein
VREHLTAQGINAYLDTPAGEVLVAQHGGRHQAAAALARAEAADREWRRAQASARAERYPERYPTVSDALRDIPDPVGGGGAQLTGSTDDIVAAGRRVDPSAGWRNLGGELPDGAAEGITQSPGRGVVAADTRPPWRRG